MADSSRLTPQRQGELPGEQFHGDRVEVLQDEHEQQDQDQNTDDQAGPRRCRAAAVEGNLRRGTEVGIGRGLRRALPVGPIPAGQVRYRIGQIRGAVGHGSIISLRLPLHTVFGEEDRLRRRNG